ncbi:MAG TPA: GNAT family N-acetyltransferase [Solirubrobacterales bacterium]|nr:GNAT family N-acetyltransferase [Solirubrobacterales bacterium]
MPPLHRGLAAWHGARQEALRRHRALLIETQRLLLRRFSEEDLDDFVALHTDPEVTRFIRPLDRAEAEERLLKDRVEWRQRRHGMLVVSDKRDGAFLGRVGLKHWPQFDETELGWALRRGAWGHGYATEAGRACRDWGFAKLEVPCLTAMIAPGNERSIAVAGRLGLTPRREDELLGEPVVVYAVDRAPWPP